MECRKKSNGKFLQRQGKNATIVFHDQKNQKMEW